MNQEEKYREDFESLNSQYKLVLNSEGNYRDSIVNRLWKNYLAACKKSQEEIEKRDRHLDEAFEYVNYFDCKSEACEKAVDEWIKQYEEMRGKHE